MYVYYSSDIKNKQYQASGSPDLSWQPCWPDKSTGGKVGRQFFGLVELKVKWKICTIEWWWISDLKKRRIKGIKMTNGC